MKKAGLLMIALAFVISMGTAYAADFNGVTDFSGRSYDTGVIDNAGHAGTLNVYEGSAPGSKRLISDFNTTGRAYDDGEIGNRAPAQAMRQNWAAQKPSYNAYDTFKISR